MPRCNLRYKPERFSIFVLLFCFLCRISTKDTPMSKQIKYCPLFKGIDPDELELLLANNVYSKSYDEGERIVWQGDRCQSLMIVAEGRVRGEMSDPAGRMVTIEDHEAPQAIATAFLYATDNRMPVNIEAISAVEMAFIPKEKFTAMLQQNALLLQNFLTAISNRSKFLSTKIRLLRFGTIQSKLAGYLWEVAAERKSMTFEIEHSQQELADRFGVTRPALARSIGEMVKEGIIASQRNHFTIIDRSRLFRLAQTE